MQTTTKAVRGGGPLGAAAKVDSMGLNVRLDVDCLGSLCSPVSL